MNQPPTVEIVLKCPPPVDAFTPPKVATSSWSLEHNLHRLLEGQVSAVLLNGPISDYEIKVLIKYLDKVRIQERKH